MLGGKRLKDGNIVMSLCDYSYFVLFTGRTVVIETKFSIISTTNGVALQQAFVVHHAGTVLNEVCVECIRSCHGWIKHIDRKRLMSKVFTKCALLM